MQSFGCFARLAVLLSAILSPSLAHAGGGYFLLGYGPYAHQSGGTAAAIGFDGFSGATNPAKLSAADERLDLGMLFFAPTRHIERRGASDAIYDFKSESRNSVFTLPEVGYVRRLGDRLSWGLTLYGNGGLNTEYPNDNGVAGSNFNPGKCGDRPANFFLGCGKLGFDLSQVVFAPTLSWQFHPRHSLGVSPLLGFQRFKAYGLQAFEAVSAHPNAVSNRGYDEAFGGGLRVGWLGRVTDWLDLGAAYSTRVYMQKFDKYRGLLADGGAFDIPSNFSVGFGLRPGAGWTVGADVQRVFFAEVPALGNGTLNSLQDPVDKPLGDADGTGFHWRNITTYRVAIGYAATPRLTVRAGWAYGKRPALDETANSTSLNMFAPNPEQQVTAGFTYAANPRTDLQVAFGNYIHGEFTGDSATAELGVGGRETIRAHATSVMLGWTRRF